MTSSMLPWIVRSCILDKGKATFLKDAITRGYKSKQGALQFCQHVGATIIQCIRVKANKHARQVNMYGQITSGYVL